MQINEELIRKITEEVMRQLNADAPKKQSCVNSLAGQDRINPEKTSYAGYPKAKVGTDPKEVVIGVGAAFQREIKKTINGIPLEDVIKNVKAGIEEEGMVPRVVKILDTSDVCFMALEAAKLSGSGIGVGIFVCVKRADVFCGFENGVCRCGCLRRIAGGHYGRCCNCEYFFDYIFHCCDICTNRKDIQLLWKNLTNEGE